MCIYSYVHVNDVMLSRAQSSAKRLASPKQIYTRPGRVSSSRVYITAADWAL